MQTWYRIKKPAAASNPQALASTSKPSASSNPPTLVPPSTPPAPAAKNSSASSNPSRLSSPSKPAASSSKPSAPPVLLNPAEVAEASKPTHPFYTPLLKELEILIADFRIAYSSEKYLLQPRTIANGSIVSHDEPLLIHPQGKILFKFLHIIEDALGQTTQTQHFKPTIHFEELFTIYKFIENIKSQSSFVQSSNNKEDEQKKQINERMITAIKAIYTSIVKDIKTPASCGGGNFYYQDIDGDNAVALLEELIATDSPESPSGEMLWRILWAINNKHGTEFIKNNAGLIARIQRIVSFNSYDVYKFFPDLSAMVIQCPWMLAFFTPGQLIENLEKTITDFRDVFSTKNHSLHLPTVVNNTQTEEVGSGVNDTKLVREDPATNSPKRAKEKSVVNTVQERRADNSPKKVNESLEVNGTIPEKEHSVLNDTKMHVKDPLLLHNPGNILLKFLQLASEKLVQHIKPNFNFEELLTIIEFFNTKEPKDSVDHSLTLVDQVNRGQKYQRMYQDIKVFHHAILNDIKTPAFDQVNRDQKYQSIYQAIREFHHAILNDIKTPASHLGGNFCYLNIDDKTAVDLLTELADKDTAAFPSGEMLWRVLLAINRVRGEEFVKKNAALIERIRRLFSFYTYDPFKTYPTLSAIVIEHPWMLAFFTPRQLTEFLMPCRQEAIATQKRKHDLQAKEVCYTAEVYDVGKSLFSPPQKATNGKMEFPTLTTEERNKRGLVNFLVDPRVTVYSRDVIHEALCLDQNNSAVSLRQFLVSIGGFPQVFAPFLKPSTLIDLFLEFDDQATVKHNSLLATMEIKVNGETIRKYTKDPLLLSRFEAGVRRNINPRVYIDHTRNNIYLLDAEAVRGFIEFGWLLQRIEYDLENGIDAHLYFNPAKQIPYLLYELVKREALLNMPTHKLVALFKMIDPALFLETLLLLDPEDNSMCGIVIGNAQEKYLVDKSNGDNFQRFKQLLLKDEYLSLRQSWLQNPRAEQLTRRYPFLFEGLSHNHNSINQLSVANSLPDVNASTVVSVLPDANVTNEAKEMQLKPLMADQQRSKLEEEVAQLKQELQKKSEEEQLRKKEREKEAVCQQEARLEELEEIERKKGLHQYLLSMSEEKTRRQQDRIKRLEDENRLLQEEISLLKEESQLQQDQIRMLEDEKNSQRERAKKLEGQRTAAEQEKERLIEEEHIRLRQEAARLQQLKVEEEKRIAAEQERAKKLEEETQRKKQEEAAARLKQLKVEEEKRIAAEQERAKKLEEETQRKKQEEEAARLKQLEVEEEIRIAAEREKARKLAEETQRKEREEEAARLKQLEVEEEIRIAAEREKARKLAEETQRKEREEEAARLKQLEVEEEIKIAAEREKARKLAEETQRKEREEEAARLKQLKVEEEIRIAAEREKARKLAEETQRKEREEEAARLQQLKVEEEKRIAAEQERAKKLQEETQRKKREEEAARLKQLKVEEEKRIAAEQEQARKLQEETQRKKQEVEAAQFKRDQEAKQKREEERLEKERAEEAKRKEQEAAAQLKREALQKQEEDRREKERKENEEMEARLNEERARQKAEQVETTSFESEQSGRVPVINDIKGKGHAESAQSSANPAPVRGVLLKYSSSPQVKQAAIPPATTFSPRGMSLQTETVDKQLSSPTGSVAVSTTGEINSPRNRPQQNSVLAGQGRLFALGAQQIQENAEKLAKTNEERRLTRAAKRKEIASQSNFKESKSDEKKGEVGQAAIEMPVVRQSDIEKQQQAETTAPTPDQGNVTISQSTPKEQTTDLRRAGMILPTREIVIEPKREDETSTTALQQISDLKNGNLASANENEPTTQQQDDRTEHISNSGNPQADIASLIQNARLEFAAKRQERASRRSQDEAHDKKLKAEHRKDRRKGGGVLPPTYEPEQSVTSHVQQKQTAIQIPFFNNSSTSPQSPEIAAETAQQKLTEDKNESGISALIPPFSGHAQLTRTTSVGSNIRNPKGDSAESSDDSTKEYTSSSASPRSFKDPQRLEEPSSSTEKKPSTASRIIGKLNFFKSKKTGSSPPTSPASQERAARSLQEAERLKLEKRDPNTGTQSTKERRNS